MVLDTFIPMILGLAEKMNANEQENRQYDAMSKYMGKKQLSDESNQRLNDQAARRQSLLSILGYNTPSYKAMNEPSPRMPYEAFKPDRFGQVLGVASQLASSKQGQQGLGQLEGLFGKGSSIGSPGIGGTAPLIDLATTVGPALV